MSKVIFNKTTGKQQGLTINIPTEVKVSVDKIFQDFPKVDLPKIYFLIYKIASSKDNQVNLKNHAWVLGFTNGEMKIVLERLKDYKIIHGGAGATVGHTSNEYFITKNYDVTSSQNFQQHYYPTQKSLPIWVQKFIGDGYIVKGKDHSNWKSISQVREDKDKTIADLYEQIKLMQQELDACYDLINLESVQDILNKI